MKKLLLLLLLPISLSAQIDWYGQKRIVDYTKEDQLKDSLEFEFMKSFNYKSDTTIYQIYDVVLTVRDTIQGKSKYYDQKEDRIKEKNHPYIHSYETKGNLIVTRTFKGGNSYYMTTKWSFYVGNTKIPFEWIESIKYIPKNINKL